MLWRRSARRSAAAAPDWLAAAARRARAATSRRSPRNPAFARTFLVEVLAAGPAALERGAQTCTSASPTQLARRARGGARATCPDCSSRPPDHVFRAAVGAVNELVTAHLRRTAPRRSPTLLPAVVDVQLALLVGRETAVRIAERQGS